MRVPGEPAILADDRYLEQLRLLAANWSAFDYLTRNRMKSAPFLLASQRVPIKRTSKKVLEKWGGGDDEYEREWVLCKAMDVSRDRESFSQG